MSKELKTPSVPSGTSDTETSRTIIVRIKAPTHKALRIRVAEEDTSIQQWVEALIERELGIRAKGAQGKK
jgi:predicted HicB family RNase H-like nuclease